ncbi:MAG: bis-aminopropyl spermidine synthase family protein, partial [Firmicutes bacterium]|nr:bis-aminopropyl spermidine synthase family protein [Bacillota bacterium]
MALERVRRQILRSLLDGPKSFWRLIRDQDGHLAHFAAVLGETVREGLVCNSDNRLSLTDKGRKAAREWKLEPLQSLACPACRGKGLVLRGRFSEVERRFRELAAGRPPAVPEFDQGWVDPTTTVARVALMYLRGDLEGRDLFILGDDDLTSLAAAITGMAGRIAVLEADERLVAFITEVAAREGLTNLEARQYDVRHPLPAELCGRFDTFVVDPVETLPGIGLFLSRCVQALKGTGSAGYLGLTHLEASHQKWFAVQNLF